MTLTTISITIKKHTTMAGNYAELLDIINNPTQHGLPAWDNDAKEIEGLTIKQYLLSIINSLTVGYQFMGMATPETNPGTPDQNVFYIAFSAGNYANFTGTYKEPGISIFKYNGSWVREDCMNIGDIFNELSITLPIQYAAIASGWQTVDLTFDVPKDSTVFIKDFFGGNITYLQLLRTDGTLIEEKTVNINVGDIYSFVAPAGLAKIRFFTTSDGTHCAVYLDVKEVVNIVSNLEFIVENIINEIGYPAKFSLSAYWQTAEYNFESGKKYIIKNTGTDTIVVFRLFNDNTQIAEYSNIESGKEITITAPASGNKIQTYSAAAVKLSIYTENSYYYMNQNKITPDAIKQVCGTGTDVLMSQAAVTNNVDSLLIDAPSYLKGIVGFLFFKHPNTNMPDIDEYTKFRISRYYHDSSYYLILTLQILYNGEWITYDAVEVPAADAPANPPQIEKFVSRYGVFFVWVNWSLMGTGTQPSISVNIKNTAVNYVDRMLYDKQQEIIFAQNFGTYELKDYIKHNIFVDANGNGDFTTIAAAYASITDSSYMNQYDVIVMPGVYNEVGLIPPVYTHTHAMNPNTVVVTSVGITSEENPPVFDIIGIGCKLSNMTIISGLGYCIHLDISLGCSVFVAENLICKKAYSGDVRNFTWKSNNNSTIIGCGSDYGGAKWIFNGCTFIDGWVACHTVPTPGTSQYADKYANQHYILRNCKLVNAIVQMISLDPANYIDYGFNVCEITGLFTQRGCPSLELLFSSIDGKPNIQWEIIGSNNENFALQFKDRVIADVEYWPAIALSSKTICELASSVNAVEKGQWITVDNTVCQGEEKPSEIFGIALETLSSGYEIQCWVGNALYVGTSYANGEYGIGSDGKLSASATQKIGYVKNNIFYRY